MIWLSLRQSLALSTATLGLAACAHTPTDIRSAAAPAVTPAAKPAPSAVIAADVGTEGDGEFQIGPEFPKSLDLADKGAPPGQSFELTMYSEKSRIFTGMDATLLEQNRHPFTRKIFVYVPAKYQDGIPAPVLVMQDGPSQLDNVKRALDNLTIETNLARRLPAFVAISVANGGGDSKGSERGLEYDTMSDRYARFIESEVLPAVLADPQVRAAYPQLSFINDPDGRATMGCSSGGAAALTMGWFRPDLFHRIVTYSGTFVDQQDDDAAEEAAFPLGAWEYHSGQCLIAKAEPKPLRIFLHVGEQDIGATAAESGNHNWVMANRRTSAALQGRNYHQRFLYALNSGHCDGRVFESTLPETLLWVWRGYPRD